MQQRIAQGARARSCASSARPASARPRSASRSPRATGRNFVRMSLGGVRDEAEIRGHRRTYIGSMPGKVIQGMKKAKTSNPLFLLDEVDKLGADWRGDPSSALLEVLDPEQNSHLQRSLSGGRLRSLGRDVRHHGQQLRMPQPLMDRMEIIRIPGYTEDEKVEIAKRHLIAKQIEGAWPEEGRVDDHRRRAARPDPLLHARGGRAQPGARDRQPGAQGGEGDRHQASRRRSTITRQNLEKYRGRPPLPLRRDRGEDMVGVVTGLAWTEVGGEMLTIEAVTAARQGQRHSHRQARRRDAGDRVGGAELCAQSRCDRASASSRRCSRSATSTCTCRKAPRPRTGRRRASRWRRRSSRC